MRTWIRAAQHRGQHGTAFICPPGSFEYSRILLETKRMGHTPNAALSHSAGIVVHEFFPMRETAWLGIFGGDQPWGQSRSNEREMR